MIPTLYRSGPNVPWAEAVITQIKKNSVTIFVFSEKRSHLISKQFVNQYITMSQPKPEGWKKPRKLIDRAVIHDTGKQEPVTVHALHTPTMGHSIGDWDSTRLESSNLDDTLIKLNRISEQEDKEEAERQSLDRSTLWLIVGFLITLLGTLVGLFVYFLRGK